MNLVTFFKRWWYSLTSVRYYRFIWSLPLSSSLKFLIASLILLGVLRGVYWQTKVWPQIENQVHQDLTTLSQNFPQNLNLTWTGSQVLIEPPQVVTVPYPQVWPRFNEQPAQLGYLVPTEGEPAELASQLPSTSLFIASPSRVYVSDLRGGWNSTLLSEVVGTTASPTLNANSAPGIVENLRAQIGSSFSFLKWWLLVLGPLWFLITTIPAWLIDVALIWLVLKVTGTKITLNQIAHLTLHLVLVAGLADFLADWMYGHHGLPIFGITFWVYLAIIWYYLRWKTAEV